VGTSTILEKRILDMPWQTKRTIEREEQFKKKRVLEKDNRGIEVDTEQRQEHPLIQETVKQDNQSNRLLSMIIQIIHHKTG
jgi:hypothetical protein